jgi:hypothetical protein
MEQWNGGKMEYWVSKVDDGLILFSDERLLYKNRSHSAKRGSSVFQHSIIPVLHGIRWRQSRLSLTWPKGPGFQC